MSSLLGLSRTVTHSLDSLLAGRIHKFSIDEETSVDFDRTFVYDGVKSVPEYLRHDNSNGGDGDAQLMLSSSLFF